MAYRLLPACQARIGCGAVRRAVNPNERLPVAIAPHKTHPHKPEFETAGKIKVQNVGKSIDKPLVMKYMYTVLICKLGYNTLKEITYRNGGG